MKRSHYCGMLTKQHIGQTVTLSGWVQTRRDLGGVLFIDLRDRTGIVQIVCNPAYSGDAFRVGDILRSEYVVTASGKVIERSTDTINSNLTTGFIEVQVTHLNVLNASKTPPFFIENGIEIDETLRLKYRYLDLRRPQMLNMLKLRSKAAKVFRDFLDDQGFIEVETPLLTKSSPEGARDYLVPSRVHAGEFYALPQSPQIYKQLLMVGGIERYYQIARCFRDEDLRADRQPEFTQVDIEASFLEQADLFHMMEQLMTQLFRQTIGVELATPFDQITYAEAINEYGSDKPDRRFDMRLIALNDIFSNSAVKVFTSVIEQGGQVKCLNAKSCATWPRKEIDDLSSYAARYGAKGLAWIQVKQEECKGPIVKFFSAAELDALKQRTNAEPGDLLLFCADQPKVVAAVLGALRLKIGRQLGLIDENKYQFTWIIDFPLLGYDQIQQRYVAEHHPFTRPKEEDVPLLDTNPAQVRAQAYDLVLNGYEVGGGSLRIYRRDVQQKMFQALGLPPEEVEEQFGYLLDAFEYGAPPHGGIALGFDRLMMLLGRCTNLRETIAFPKTAQATDLMMNAPATVEATQLEQLHIQCTPRSAKSLL